ncbi:O-antigen ligase family protein [Clostridium botulinum]|uniref:O-antigen ligase family protein n=1 Tax=Clostridium botulinum TaxID=1491 RepID=A0A846JRS4_CLOBO|nr:O-antigen ligase family protein [Clostridium botulinum]KOM87603.1 O-antigen polymerase [Clostridium botulinum]KOR61610.1 O-antigen polymerase [Clostridium botulinum]MBN1049846.1 O-antigen ligase domain-containing protein [Clostridium botulinum]MBN1075552.1 O-antigen ligase domain-containing protein [Clostridium botulinum]MCS6111185.1 O-antigen ligase domain-containing protein [Clostridium botulinum]
MSREDKTRIIFITLISIIAMVFGVANGNYVIPIMYIITLVISSYIIQEKNIYDQMYCTLLVSAFYDYALHAPGIESIYIFHVVLGLCTLMSLYKLVKDREVIRNIDKKILGIYVIWFVYMCASIFWAMSKSLSIKYIAIYLMMFAFIFNMMVYNTNKDRLKKTVKILLFLISLITLIGFIEVLLGKQLPIKHYADHVIDGLPQKDQNQINARPMAFSFNPNNLAATLAILSPLFFFAIYRCKNIFWKIGYVVISTIVFILIGTTTSRTGFVSILFGVVTFLIFSIFNIKKIGIKNVIFPIILCITLVLSYNYSYLVMNIKPIEGEEIVENALNNKMHSLENIEFQEGGEGSVNVRFTIINDVINGTIKEKNYLGYGVGNVENFIKEQKHTGKIYSPHCYAIEILGDFGLPGVALYGVYYLYLLIGNIVLGIKRKSMYCFAAATGLITFAPASFGPSSITYVFSYWILIGFAVSCMQVYKRSDSEYTQTSGMKEFHF